MTRWQVGDEVYGELGLGGGGFAEYAVVDQAMLVAKPPTLSFEEAAAVPLAGRTALVCLREASRLADGQRLLVNGASGGVGTYAVQIGHALGAEVTAVCRTRNVDLVRSLGAKHVIDYTREDVAASGSTYDVVLDLVGNRTLRDLRRLVTPGGVLVLSGGGNSTGKRQVLGPAWLMLRGEGRGAVPEAQGGPCRRWSPNPPSSPTWPRWSRPGRSRRSWTGPFRWPRRRRR